MAMLDSTTDRTTDGAMPERFRAEAPGRRGVIFKALTNVRPGHPADPELFDFAKLAAGVELRPGGPENP
jgi:tRNA 2-thiocytidine biosynthesis protein TtcA